MKIVPLHCLVLCDDTLQSMIFPRHEHISLSSIAYDLVGSQHGTEIAPIVWNELRHRVALKLSLGERVVMVGHDLSAFQQQQMVDLAFSQGARIMTLMSRDLPHAERIGETDISLATKLPHDPYEILKQRWKGITVMGDLHGTSTALTRALDWATARQHFAWLLGDVIDYGPNSLQTIEIVYDAVMHGRAGMIIGNHERKIARLLDQRDTGRTSLRVSEGNRITMDAIDRLNADHRKRWIGQFRSLLGCASLLQPVENIVLTHAALHPTFWGNKPDDEQIERFALYGEADYRNGRFRRSHHWVDAVPANQTVFVGHDILSQFPMVTTGAKGGQVVFLDTGCGKGGQLSSADIRFTANGLHLECFNRH